MHARLVVDIEYDPQGNEAFLKRRLQEVFPFLIGDIFLTGSTEATIEEYDARVTVFESAEIARYVKSEGSTCPVCGDNNLEGVGSYDADGDWIAHGIRCLNCDSEWEDIYKLADIYNLVRGPGHEAEV